MGLVHGFDANLVQRALLVDAQGRPIVTLGPSSETIGTVNLNRADPLPVTQSGYRAPQTIDGVVKVAYDNTNLPAGDSSYDLYTVPSGHYAILTYINLRYTGTVTGVRLYPAMYDGSTDYVFITLQNITSGTWYTYNLQIVLGPTYHFKVFVVSATAGDDLSVRAFGYTLLA